MKKVNYLLVLIFSIVVLTTSCEKDSDTNDPKPPVEKGLISMTELDGYWDFVSYQYNGKTYITCDDTYHDALTKPKGWLILSLNFAPSTGGNEVTLIDACGGANSPTGLFSLNVNTITIDNGLVFQVQSYNSTTKKMVLKLTGIGTLAAPYAPSLNSLYTLKKH